MAKNTKKIQEKIIKPIDMTLEELVSRAKEIEIQIKKKKLELAVGRSKNIKESYNLRKELARIKTIISLKNAVKSGSK